MSVVDNWAYCMLLMKKLAVFIGLFLLLPARVWAASAETTQNMILGTYIQTASRASGVLSSASAISNFNGLIVGSSTTKASAIIRLKGSEFIEPISYSSGGSVVLADTPGCTITVSDLTFDQRSPFFSFLGSTRDLKIGATVTISGGFCSEGTYHGAGSLKYGGTNTQNFDISITLESPLDIVEVTGMDFGTMLSPYSNSTVTLSPLGGYTKTGDIQFVDDSLTPGEFTVTGVGGRQVNITMPTSTTVSNGTATMTIDNFKSNPSVSFVLGGSGTGQTQSVKTGATLHINKNQKAGTYTGTYPVIVSY